MSDDLFDAFGDDELFEEEEEVTQVVEDEGQNRTFIIAVAVLGGLLICSLVAFGVWAFVLNRPQPADVAPTDVVTPTIDAAAQMTATSEVLAATSVAATEQAPTDTPEPTATATPVVQPTETPAGETDALGESATAAEAGAIATPLPRRTATPTPMSADVLAQAHDANTSFGTSGELAQTGLGEWLMVGVALMLVSVMVLARRMRSA